MPALLSLKNNYYVRRLAPFLIVYVVYELIEVAVLAFLQGTGTDGNTASILQLLGNLVVETCSSFLYLIIPYLLYLATLPGTFHGSRADRILTTIFFAFFCILNSSEEMAEILSGDHFSFYSRQFLQSPRDTWNHLATAIPVLPVVLGVLAVSTGTVVLFFKKLVPPLAAPSAPVRAAAPILAYAAAFILSWGSGGAMGNAAEHDEIGRDGLFTLFGDLFAVTKLPHLPSIFGIPVLITACAILLILVAEHLSGRFIPSSCRPSFLARNLFRSMKKAFHLRSDFALWLLLFLVAVLLLRLISMGAYPLMDTTEARYAEMSRKMLETGHWLVPQFDYGVPFWGKPPLSFWASAVTMKLGGVNEWSARLAPFLASLIMGLLFFAWPFRSQSRQKAAACFLVLAASGIGFVASGAVMTDEFLALGIMLSMVSFWKAVTQPSVRTWWGYLFFVGLAVGLLSKGPLALVLTGFPIFLWTLWNREWKNIWSRLPWIRGTVLMLALSLPWYLLAEQETPGFLHYFIVGEHYQRFMVKGWQGDLYGSGHASPPGTIWLYGLTMFLPWTFLLPFLRMGKPSGAPGETVLRGESSFLWLWALSPLLFFTLARNILPAYVLPGIPAWCILTVRGLWRWDSRHPGIKNLIFLPASMFAVIAFFLLGNGFDQLEYRCQKQLLQSWNGSSPLYCWDNVRAPYSAQFYSSGKVKRLEPGTLPPENGKTYLAMKRTDYNQYRSMLKGWKREAEERLWLLLSSPGDSGTGKNGKLPPSPAPEIKREINAPMAAEPAAPCRATSLRVPAGL